MKIPENKIFGLYPDKHNFYNLLENRLIIASIPLEEFAVWAYLLYSHEISERISYDLIFNKRIFEN